MRAFTPTVTAAAAAFLIAATQVADANDAQGLWLTKGRDAKIRIAACGDSLCGSIAWLARPIDRDTGRPATDKNNADPSRRARPLVGVRIFGMPSNGRDRWSGPIYNAEDGKTYSGTVELIDANTIKIQGCLGPFCDYEMWTRTN